MRLVAVHVLALALHQLERDAQAPADYVDTWSSDAGETDDVRATQWRRWLVDRGVEAVGFGWVVLRRGDAPHRVAVESVPQQVEQPLGEAIDSWLARLSWLRGLDDAGLLSTRLRAADGVRRESSARASAGGWTAESARLVLGSGFRWSLECDDAVAALVAGCDGGTRLRDLVDVLAVATGVPTASLATAVCSTAASSSHPRRERDQHRQ